MDDGLGLLAALLFVAEGVRPGRGQLEHVIGIHLRQRAPALGIGAHAVLQHVVGGQVVVGDVVPGHRGGQGTAAQAKAGGQQQTVNGQRQWAW